MALNERSAGVIIYRSTQGPDSSVLYLLLNYGKYWDYAKGHIEKGEDDRAAALRELREETGIEAVELLPAFTKEIAYFFRSKRGLVRKSVIYYLGSVTSTNVQLSEEHVGYEWLTFPAAIQRLGYASAREVLIAANDHLAEQGMTSPSNP